MTLSKRLWETSYSELAKQADEDELMSKLTSAAITGRYSIILEAMKAYEDNLTLEQFIDLMGPIVKLEINEGVIDEGIYEEDGGVSDPFDGDGEV